ncbi:MAG: hypothetical protein HRU17_05180 [Polyangiaceae bacterium]|nr:hypothetical protein [Polyangiaceae bacterium]
MLHKITPLIPNIEEIRDTNSLIPIMVASAELSFGQVQSLHQLKVTMTVALPEDLTLYSVRLQQMICAIRMQQRITDISGLRPTPPR